MENPSISNMRNTTPATPRSLYCSRSGINVPSIYASHMVKLSDYANYNSNNTTILYSELINQETDS